MPGGTYWHSCHSFANQSQNKKQDEGLTNAKGQSEISTERFKNSSNNPKTVQWCMIFIFRGPFPEPFDHNSYVDLLSVNSISPGGLVSAIKTR